MDIKRNANCTLTLLQYGKFVFSVCKLRDRKKELCTIIDIFVRPKVETLGEYKWEENCTLSLLKYATGMCF